MAREYLLIGNCHTLGVNLALKASGRQSTYIPATTDRASIENAVKAARDDGHQVVVLSSMLNRVAPALEKMDRRDVILMPYIRNAAYQPDCIHLARDGKGVESDLENAHSSIIVSGFLAGLSAQETRKFFDPDFFGTIGFYDYWEHARAWFERQQRLCGWSLMPLVEKWRSEGCVYFTPNHPKQVVFNDIAEAISTLSDDPVDLDTIRLKDRGENYTQWPVYPGIADQFGLDGSFEFTLPVKTNDGKLRQDRRMTIDDLIDSSFQRYSEDGLANVEISDQMSKIIDAMRLTRRISSRKKAGSGGGKSTNPYSTMPDYQYWRRSISRQEMGEVDPVLNGAFSITSDDAVATAGSCFAQHIARTISSSGFNYYVPEQAPEGEQDPAKQESYGLYSARYGNIYTARQLKQLFQRAYGHFSPVDDYWEKGDGFVDPFRPNVETFGTVEALRADRAKHLKHVREMIEKLDVFVFTLGLTEAWRSKIDGAVYPIVPGASGGTFNPELHESVNFTVDEVVADVSEAFRILFEKNPDARVILTVSPVPLVATFEDRHVLSSTTYSKSVLRVAAETVQQRFGAVAYFPSYEIITGNFNEGRYFEEDKRGVRPEGVAHVMKLFSRHYLGSGSNLEDEQMAAAERDAQVVCDEEDLETLRPEEESRGAAKAAS